MFTAGPASGFTVPNTFNSNIPMPVTEAFYNNNSSCCYRLAERLNPSDIAAEKHDWRDNLDFLRSIGANFLTADDTDSIELYSLSQGYLDTAVRPNPSEPPAMMNSSLYYRIRELSVPDRAIVQIKGWNGGSAAAWGGEVCMWTNPGDYLWTVKCDYEDAPYSNVLQIENVDETKMRIRDPKSLQCLYSDPGLEDRVSWSKSCDSPRAWWTRTPEHRFLDQDGREVNFQWDDRYSYGHPFAYNYFTRGDTSTWSQWKLHPAD